MIEKLIRREGIDSNQKITKLYDKMQALIDALDKKDIPSEQVTFINEHIVLINSFSGSEKELIKALKNAYSQILKEIKEKLKLVPKNHYLSLGLVFGLLAGVVFPSVFRDFEFMGLSNSQSLGISFGMLIGIIIGSNLDRQAKKNGKQLEF